MTLLAVIVLAIILILLLFRPQTRPSPRRGDSDDLRGSGLTGRDSDYMADDPKDFEPGGGDFGGAGASGSWDSDDDESGDDGDGGD